MCDNSLWFGFKKEEFEFEGRQAIIVFPKEAESEINWTLKTEYWGAFPNTEIELLKRGFHAAYLQNISRFATKEDCDSKARFVEYISEKYGLRNKCVPVGMSCGGAHAMNFAGFHPESVACMFIDAPVLNFCSFPGKLGSEKCEGVWENEFVKAYPGITRAGLLNFDNHPISKIPVLQENKIPVIMLYGTEDQTVIYNENGALMELEYKNCPELLKVVPRNFQGHHPHGLPEGNTEVVDFIWEKSRK